jgi:septum formation protein
MSASLILASASSRRADLLRMIGCRFDVMASDVDEQTEAHLTAGQTVTELAGRKAHHVAQRNGNRIVIGADTVVTIDGRILGKPEDREHAKKTLKELSGVTHQVLTAVSLISLDDQREEQVLATTSVTFRDLNREEIERYLDTDEPYDKAGAYGIQGKASLFAERIDGCFYNVVGFPVTQFWLALSRITDGNPWSYCTSRHAPDLLSL